LFGGVTLSLLIATALVLVTAAPVGAGTTGKIAGRVVDGQTGDPLPGVNVIVEGTTMGAATDLEGYFTILQVPPGVYRVTASMVGYKTVTQVDVLVRVDLTTTVNFSLEPTVVMGEAVSVVAERPLVISDLTSSSNRLSTEEIEDIPTVTSVTEAVAIMPGFVGEGEQIHARGGRAGEVVYMIDGVPVNDPQYNTEIIDVNKYAISEVEVITGGYNAEYGNVQSGVVNIVTRSGGPNYSGRVAYFTDDFGSGRFVSDQDPMKPRAFFKPIGSGLRKYSFNTDRWETNLGGPEPIANKVLPALGIDALKGRVNFFLSGTAAMTDGYLPNEDQSRKDLEYHPREAVVGGKTVFLDPVETRRHPFLQRFLGFDWGGRFRNDLNYNGSLNIRLSPVHKLSFSYVGSQFWRDSYTHIYKFVPDHTTQTEGRNYNTVLTWTHNLSPKTFYTLRLSKFRNWRWQYPGMRNGIPYEPGRMNLLEGDGLFNFFDVDDPNDPRSGFYESGWLGRRTWATHTSTTYTLKLDILSQVHRNHELKGGIEWRNFDLHQEQIDNGGSKVPSRLTNPPDEGRWPDAGALRDFYDRNSNGWAIYLQDKIEYQSLIVNAGLRFELFDPGSQVFEIPEAFQTEETERKPVNDKMYLSPRLGISHPITERSMLYFFYGRFLQMPTLRELYRRQNRFRVFQNQLNLFGNPDLEAEETISYEVGFDHQLFEDLKIGITGFFKDVRNQINSEVFGPTAAPFRKLVNRDFGSDRGFEFDLRKRYKNFFSANINYTLSWATTRASTFPRGVTGLGAQTFPNIKEVPADWDQRHTINANIYIEVPAGRGLKIGPVQLSRWGLNVLWRYGSGQPFTPSEDVDPTATTNSRRLPYFSLLDIRFRKDIPVTGDVLANFYIDVYNVLNRRNVFSVNTARECLCPEGNGTPVDLNPQRLGAPRQILVGLGVRF
jgi:outer membrane receptor protein involved in Fe transport